MTSKDKRREVYWVLLWAAAIGLLSSIPYIFGMHITPPGYKFLGLTHNIDDGAVYLSWMRQAADGHLFIKNLFTNHPQLARQINVLFLIMGGFSRLTGLSLILTYHLFRLLLTCGLFLSVCKFAQLFLHKAEHRRLALILLGVSSGIGWLIPNVRMPIGSVDMWQPEAVTFLSIYLNPLFLAGLVLMVGALYSLVIAQRSGRMRDAICAGLFLLLLGNVHTYDVVTVACVWGAYLLTLWAVERRFPARAVALSIVAAIIAIPSVAYQYHLYQIDAIFRARANSPIPSPVIWSYVQGYGLVLIGALVGAVYLYPRLTRHNQERESQHLPASPLLLIVWSVIGFVVPYIPVGQQRKLIMGIHIPLCLLCAYGVFTMVARFRPSTRRALILAFILLSAGSNFRFLADDMSMLSKGRTAPGYPPYMSISELDAMNYLSNHTKPDASVLAPPTFALFTPAFTGRAVSYGHWSETPNYAESIAQWAKLGSNISTNTWYALVFDGGIGYYIQAHRNWEPPADKRKSLIKTFSSGDISIYCVPSTLKTR